MTDKLRKALRDAQSVIEDACRSTAIYGYPPPQMYLDALKHIDAALATPDERISTIEECAKICDDECMKYSINSTASNVANDCAAAIRALAQPEAQPTNKQAGEGMSLLTP